MKIIPNFKINLTENLHTCFPENLDATGFLNMSRIGDRWAIFLNPDTGEVHDCKVYYSEVLLQIKRSEQNDK